jgi:hypothetical protein
MLTLQLLDYLVGHEEAWKQLDTSKLHIKKDDTPWG